MGLEPLVGYELCVSSSDKTLSQECFDFIKFVADYILNNRVIQHEETFLYGYWLTKVFLTDGHKLVFYEYNLEATDFIFGITNTLHFWKTQHEVCMTVNAEFSPIRPDQLVVISDGVYEGEPTEGVRYPSPQHMSGWWLTTDLYNGDINTLKTVHAHHVAKKRPDLVKYFGLPFGYRFFARENDIWFDSNIMNN
ncbi:hypothetical protein H0S63_22100 [Shewanella algae]|nr:hypothetical protein [Shewanella algae]